MAAAVADYDCQACGACCVNPPENRAQGYTYYVEVMEDDRLLERGDLVRKLVVRDRAGVPHLRLAPDGRCIALRGTLGKRVSCGIYRERPTPCRRVQPGDALCLRYRAGVLAG
jgi:Fe-S-cluster containining protein